MERAREARVLGSSSQSYAWPTGSWQCYSGTERIEGVKWAVAWSLDDGTKVERRRGETPTESPSVKVTRSRQKGREDSSKTGVWVIEGF